MDSNPGPVYLTPKAHGHLTSSGPEASLSLFLSLSLSLSLPLSSSGQEIPD